MKPVRRAVIDVGTNSVKLLVAEVIGREVRPIWEQSKQTRLGRGFYPARLLQPGPIAQTAKAVAEFAAKALELGASIPQVIATSAARDALNQQELIGGIGQASGLAVRVISGDEEAAYVFQGIATDPKLAQEPVLLLDVGGGSTEFIVGRNREKNFARSFPMGTVRLLELIQPANPPGGAHLTACREWLSRYFAAEISPLLLPLLREECNRTAGLNSLKLVGTGGTATILGCMEARLGTFDRERLENTQVTYERLRWHVERLWGLSTAEREHIVGLPANRADVILTGTAIFEAVMNHLSFEILHISTRGLRFALVMD